mgnify:CR=1 FL=1
MSTYNGEKYIENQIKSLIKQKEVKIKLLIRDDGSTDSTLEKIQKIINKYPEIEIKLLSSKNIGYAKSFWDLLNKADLSCEYFAFCDQDDIWLENKLICAIKMIEESKKSKTPILYTSNVTSIDNNMNILSRNTFNSSRSLSIYESLQKNNVPGCTYVMNREAILLARKYNGYMESHDWALYNIVNIFGKVIYDKNSYILYRIHGSNALGKKSLIKELKMKISRFFNKNMCTRSKFTKDFNETFYKDIPEKIRYDIKCLAYYKVDLKYKLHILLSSKYKGFIFKIYIILNKV